MGSRESREDSARHAHVSVVDHKRSAVVSTGNSRDRQSGERSFCERGVFVGDLDQIWLRPVEPAAIARPIPANPKVDGRF